LKYQNVKLQYNMNSTHTDHLEKIHGFIVMSTNPLLNDRRIGPIINPLNVDDPNVKLGKGNVWWSNEIETTTNINQEEIKAMIEK